MYSCVHIPLLSLCCRPHLLIFLRCSLAFVILHVSTLLVFMPLFSELCLLFCCSSPTEQPYGLLTSHILARYPRHIQKFQQLVYYDFFTYLLFILYFCFILIMTFFSFGPIQWAPLLLKLLKVTCVFDYLLFCCSFCRIL